MISPEQRSLLTDALTPPAGHQFEAGLATTFSLDLVTLLTLPLHLAWIGTADSPPGQIDPLPVLEAIRRTAGRLTVFCQRGRLQIPRSASPLLGLLEGMVHEAFALHGGAFHPKVWLLKFVPNEGADGGNARLRLLILSRNLTDDRSWDLSLQLDGSVGKAKLALNRQLSQFLKAMPNLSHKPITDRRGADLAQLSDDAARCKWDLPGQFEEIRFHSLGISSKPIAWLPEVDSGLPWDEFGVVSPFVGAEALSRLSKLAKRRLFLLSRPDELDKLDPIVLEEFEKVWVLDEGAEAGDLEDDAPSGMRGLHAKVFVGKRGWNTHLFVGSANATYAALIAGSNVEFMAELIGRASKVGTPSNWDSVDGLQPLLTPYVRCEQVDGKQQEDEQRLEDLRGLLAEAKLHLRCSNVEEGWALDLSGIETVNLGDVNAHVWPVTLQRDRAVQIPHEHVVAPLRLGILATQNVTSFTAFALNLGESVLSFALDLPIEGAPENRDLEVLRAALRNREGFVRYLLLLLGDWEDGGADDVNESGWKFRWTGQSPDDAPLFEMLARAFARDPARLKQVGSLVTHLTEESTADEERILPPDFEMMWRIFEQAMSTGMKK